MTHPKATPSNPAQPRLIFWETTVACNLNCSHCRRTTSTPLSHELSTSEATELLINPIASNNWKPILVFSGGEPLARNDILPIITHTTNKGIHAAIATNGTLINNTIAHDLANAGISRASVSLDAATPTTHDSIRGIPGSFNLATSGIQALRNAGIDVQINSTITKANRNEVDKLLDLVHDLDTCALHVFLLVPTGCGAQLPEHIRLEPYEVEQLLRYLDSEATKRNMEIRATCAPQAQRIRLQQIRTRAKSEQPPGRGLAPSSKGCLAGNGIVFISATGIAFPCGYLPTPIGNIREQPLASILTTSELLSSLRDTTNLEGRCRNCEYNKCCGGCRARAFATSNNLFGEEPSCTMPSNAEPPMTNTR